jgi:hypothetical protein
MTKTRRSDPGPADVDLSGAARAVVRDAGDPRIDAHLAALGLGDVGPTAGGRRARDASTPAAETAELRGRVSELEARLTASERRARQLMVVVSGAAITIAVLLVLVVAR